MIQPEPDSKDTNASQNASSPKLNIDVDALARQAEEHRAELARLLARIEQLQVAIALARQNGEDAAESPPNAANEI